MTRKIIRLKKTKNGKIMLFVEDGILKKGLIWKDKKNWSHYKSVKLTIEDVLLSYNMKNFVKIKKNYEILQTISNDS